MAAVATAFPSGRASLAVKLADVEYGDLGTPRDDVGALAVVAEQVDRAALERFPKLRVVANYGAGYDLVDVDACRERGVVVTNTPGVTAAATADLKAEGLHPFGHLTKPNGSTPKCWQRGEWAKFIDEADDVRREIKYVEDNPLKEGKGPQRWSFVVPYTG